MLNKLFESLDEKVFTDELKESLETSFNEAVELKAVELSETKIDEKIDELSEKAEEFEATIVEKYEAKEAALLEQVDSYLEKVVEEFVTEAKDSLEEIAVNEKADLMVEAFDSMIIAGGVEVSSIVEAKETTDVETQLEESVAKYDKLIEENIALGKEVSKLIQMGIIAEMQEDMSIVEAAKFAKLAELVEFSKDSAYGEKLDTIAESVKGAKETVVTESLNEDTKETVKSYSHLV